MKHILLSEKNFSKTNSGVFEGWGTSLCWWANRVGFSEKLVDESVKLFFSKEGLNLNIMRYNIGGGDDPSHAHIKRTDSEIPGWWKYDKEIKKFVFNPDTDKNQLEVLKAAYKAAGKDAFVEAFSNSPPYFMTVSGCSSGHTKKYRNNLKKSAIKPFARYLSDVCFCIQKKYGIIIRSLAPMNEPFTDFWTAYSPKQEGCYISPGKMQSDVILATKYALKNKGLSDIIVTASDETNTKLQYFSMKLMNRKALAAVGRISTHTYSKATPQIGEFSRSHSKNLWMDESDWSGVCGIDSGEMGPALWLCEKIIEDINTFSPTAWVIWQIVAAYISKVPDSKGRLDMPGIPDLTQGFWGTAFADIDKEEIYLTQKYYAFGQFTRYIRPGMTIIHTDDSETLAAYDKNSKKLVIVAMNRESMEKEISFDFRDIDINSDTVNAVRTSGDIKSGEHWSSLPEIKLSENTFYCTLKENSITTFIIE